MPASIRNLHRVGVIYKPLQDVSTAVAMGMIWRREETRPVLQRFLQVVNEVASLQKASE